MVPLDRRLQWVNLKQKTFRKIEAHSGIGRHVQELFRQNPDIIKAVVHPEL